MITVFIREVEEIKGHKLGEFYPEDLPVLVTRLKEYTVYANDAIEAAFSEARFICHDGNAYFEILIKGE